MLCLGEPESDVARAEQVQHVGARQRSNSPDSNESHSDPSPSSSSARGVGRCRRLRASPYRRRAELEGDVPAIASQVMIEQPLVQRAGAGPRRHLKVGQPGAGGQGPALVDDQRFDHCHGFVARKT